MEWRFGICDLLNDLSDGVLDCVWGLEMIYMLALCDDKCLDAATPAAAVFDVFDAILSPRDTAASIVGRVSC